ncbi:MAG: SMP-30/gluconolactonase/LRE family protein [Planctomycetota bacterium]
MPELLVADAGLLAENPLWDEESKTLAWTDIDNGLLLAWSADSNSKSTRIYHGPQVGGFTRQRDGSLLLFRVEDIAVLNADGTVRSVARCADPGSIRFNDVVADPLGRVFAGTIGQTPDSGGVFRIDYDGSIHKVIGSTGISNGMGFSPDRRTMYWTCSTTARIWAYDYDVGSGRLGARRCIQEPPADGALPDGLTVDAEGCLWSARWDGSCVVRMDPTGRIMTTIPMPTRNVTSLTFGGPDLRDLFITSAADAAHPHGALHRVRAAGQGVSEFRSAIVTS